MTSKLYSGALIGLESELVEVEADISFGLPSFIIVGLPDTAIQESRDRVRTALKNIGFSFPEYRVTVNLAPADIKKEGPAYDLPIALAILKANEQLGETDFFNSLFIGELSLEAKLRPITGALAIVLMAKEKKIKNIFLPCQNAEEASLVPDINIFPVHNLKELISHLTGEKKIPVLKKKINLKFKEDFGGLDMRNVRGQETAKRALEIAASGGHNLAMTGPPGSGKTILSKTMITIMPRLDLDEVLEVTRIYSVAKQLSEKKPLMVERPFRSPHHSSSTASLVGGGRVPKPGEISLAHRGVLFLDEFPEFPRSVLEALRQPLEDRVVTVSRVQSTISYPANFILVTAQNPCPCGYLGDPQKECTCTALQVNNYHKKVSGPILDRIDMFIEVPRIKFEKLSAEPTAENSVTIRARVEEARAIQRERFKNIAIFTNSEMNNKEIDKYCQLDVNSKGLLKTASQKLNLSPRGYFRILKLARTIADLGKSEHIKSDHLAEALQYRG
ncbi:MAG: YifB family Mg chelatase-like AAA ATPase [Patescibacteria group bacterium]|nr:YifB family Mg chelatase-like AAA ATPase [Patescibacteria group bacterium]